MKKENKKLFWNSKKLGVSKPLAVLFVENISIPFMHLKATFCFSYRYIFYFTNIDMILMYLYLSNISNPNLIIYINSINKYDKKDIPFWIKLLIGIRDLNLWMQILIHVITNLLKRSSKNDSRKIMSRVNEMSMTKHDREQTTNDTK